MCVSVYICVCVCVWGVYKCLNVSVSVNMHVCGVYLSVSLLSEYEFIFKFVCWFIFKFVC